MISFVAAFLRLPGVVLAQSRRAPARPHIMDRDYMFECPLQVSGACMERCTGAPQTRSCPWVAFGCDFQVCWAGTRMRIFREDLARVVDDPASYAIPGVPAGPNGVNTLSTVRIFWEGETGLYLSRGRFNLDMYGLSAPAEGRNILQWGQACALLAAQQHPDVVARSAGSSAVYRVRCGGGRVSFQDIPALPLGDPPLSVAAQPPAPVPQPSGGQPAPIDYDAIRRMSDQDLTRRLEATGHVQVSGNLVRVNGVLPFSPNTSDDGRSEDLESLSDEDRVGLKERYTRTVHSTLGDAERDHPAPEGQSYVYDDETGQATLRANPPPPPGKI
jgi:hypothetical protein